MKKFFQALALFVGLLFAVPVQAATCFAVGTGAGVTWSTTNGVMWSSSSGGAGSTCAATGGVPKNAGDVATFDGASGGGVVTVDTTINGITIATITSSAFTGTLDFSVNNPSMTLTNNWTDAGTGIHTVNLGSGTFTFNLTNGTALNFTSGASLTLNAGTSTILANSGVVSSAGSVSLFLGSFTYSTVTIGSISTNGSHSLSGSPTITNLNIIGPNHLTFITASATVTTSNLSITGSFGSQPYVAGTNGVTLSQASGTPTINWAAIFNLAFAGGATFAATNSFDLKGNSGITFASFSSGGARCIGC